MGSNCLLQRLWMTVWWRGFKCLNTVPIVTHTQGFKLKQSHTTILQRWRQDVLQGCCIRPYQFELGGHWVHNVSPYFEMYKHEEEEEETRSNIWSTAACFVKLSAITWPEKQMCVLTFQEGDGQLICVQVADIFPQVRVQHPGNEALQHPGGSGLMRATPR